MSDTIDNDELNDLKADAENDNEERRPISHLNEDNSDDELQDEEEIIETRTAKHVSIKLSTI